MRNIIIGNGVNIQFDGWDYTNRRIVERALFKLKTRDYSKKIYTEEIEVWIKMLFQAFPNFLKGAYDKLAVLKDEKEELANFKKRYTKKTRIYEIGFEDFFLLNELFCRKNKIGNPERNDFQEFLRRLFLDSIYNNGKINQIYENFNENFIAFLKSYDNIFTTNYDRNIELATKREVLYLHGAFHVLDNVYDPNSFRNQLSDRPCEKTPVIKGYEHVFSTALTGSSGAFKQHVAESLELANSGIKKFSEGMKNKPEIRREIAKWKDSDNDIIRNLYEAIQLKSQNPDLKFSIDYTLNKLNEIEGVITLIGLSPNNDSHILSIILNNKQIDLIEFYYYEESEKKDISSYFHDKRIEILNVTEFWNRITSP